jgi:hypothetical protein
VKFSTLEGYNAIFSDTKGKSALTGACLNMLLRNITYDRHRSLASKQLMHNSGFKY